MFGYSTGGLVSCLSPAYGGSAITINIPTYFKEKIMAEKREQRDRKTSNKLVHIQQVIGLARTFKIITLALHRTEAKIASDISFVVMHRKVVQK